MHECGYQILVTKICNGGKILKQYHGIYSKQYALGPDQYGIFGAKADINIKEQNKILICKFI